MGLLESALGAVMGGSSQQQGGLADVLGGLLANNSEGGGLQGLVEKFSQAGMGNVIQSWIGTGSNLPVSSEQISSVLGSDMVSGLAAKLGLDSNAASGQIAQMLPGLIDSLTPNGRIPEGGLGMAGDLLKMLGGTHRG